MIAPSIRSNLALADAGFLPRGIVVGAATYQILQPMGCQGLRLRRRMTTNSKGLLSYPGYVEGITKTWMDAITRLEQEAVACGAHGVAGVTATRELLPDNAPTYQVKLIGNAVGVRGVAPLARPFLSMLSMEQTLKLLLRGWVPVGIGVGVSALHVHGFNASAFWQGGWTKNIELAQPTEAMQFARHEAEAHLRRCPGLRKASGVVGAQLDLTYTTEQCAWSGTGMRVVGELTGTGVIRFGPPTVPIDLSLSIAKDVE